MSGIKHIRPIRGKCIGDISQLSKRFIPKENVLIVGAGPSANILKHPDFPWDRYSIIACNSAILLCNPDVWMSFDLNSWRDSWWGEGGANFYLLGIHQISQANGHDKFFPHNYYTFDHVHSIHLDAVKMEPLRLLGGGTITACAVQFAASYQHIKAIHLTGCDFGNMNMHFYDDKEPPSLKGQIPNSQAHRMNWALDRCRERGIDILHYGDTLLRAKVVKL